MYKELTIDSAPENLYQVEKFVEEICDAYYIFNSYYGNILLAVEEAVRNAIIHGNRNDHRKKVLIKFNSSKNGLSFIIEDEGKGFDYKSVPNPLDVDETVIEQTGKGLFLIRSLADKVLFNPSGNQIEINFNISSLNQETTVNRISKLQKYFQKQKTTA